MPERSEIRANEVPDAYGSFIESMRGADLEVLSDAQIKEMIGQIRNPQTGEEERRRVRNRIVNANIPLIPFLIGNASRRGIRPEELVGEAFETLDECIDSWQDDGEDDAEFSSHAAASIEKRLGSPRSAVEIGKPIDVPESVNQIVTIMKRARELFTQEHGREPSHKEWYKRAAKLRREKYDVRALERITPETFKNTYAARFGSVARIGEVVQTGGVDPDSLSPHVEKIDVVDPEDFAIIEDLKMDVGNALESLTGRERFVIEWRFGIGFDALGKPKVDQTLEGLGKMLGVSKTRVGRIEARALRKLSRSNLKSPITEIEKPEILYVDTLEDVARKFIVFGSPKGFRDTLAQSIYSAKDGKPLNPLVFGFGRAEIMNILPVLGKLDIDGIKFAQDIALKISQYLMEMNRNGVEVNNRWMEINKVDFTREDIEKWKGDVIFNLFWQNRKVKRK